MAENKEKCNDKHSEWLNIIACVTQGSVLGPALFLLFISDMNEYLPTTAELIKYADDLLNYCIFNNLNENDSQQTVDSIQEWVKQNKIKSSCASLTYLVVPV